MVGAWPCLIYACGFHHRSVGAQVNACALNCNPFETLVIAVDRPLLLPFTGPDRFAPARHCLLRQIGRLNCGQGDGVDDVVDQCTARQVIHRLA